MTLVEAVVLRIMPHMVNFSIFKIFFRGDFEHLIAVCLCQKLALIVEQFQSIPLARIVTGRDDDAAIGRAHSHGEFCCRRCGQAYVENIIAHTHECAADNVSHHVAGDSRITAHNDLVACRMATASDERCISCSKFHNVERIQCVACTTTDGSANT